MRILPALILALIIGAGSTAHAHNAGQKHGSQQQHLSGKTKKATPNKKPKPKKKIPRRPAVAPEQKSPIVKSEKLTGKQEEIRDAFRDCMSRASAHDPVGAVKQFVFDAQRARENGIWGIIEAFRGSPVHHGHEVCLSRAYGLTTFRTVDEIKAEHDNLLFRLDSPDLFFPKNSNGKSEVPPERRYAREWVVDYVHALAKDFRSQFGVPLRVGSVVRDAATQNMLVRQGLSPADCRYEFLCSTHTSGSAIDLGTKDVPADAVRWLRERLLADQRDQKIFFIRENSHFHLFILPPDYMGEE